MLFDEDRDLIDSGLAPFAEYQKASQAALERATVEGDDPYTAQQAAAKLTSGKDRPVSAVLKELSTRLNERARTEGSAIESDVDALLPVVVGSLVAALLLGLGVAFGLARSIAGAARHIARRRAAWPWAT